jgi:hypothetical protein
MFLQFDLVVRGFTPEQGFAGSFRPPPPFFYTFYDPLAATYVGTRIGFFGL